MSQEAKRVWNVFHGKILSSLTEETVVQCSKRHSKIKLEKRLNESQNIQLRSYSKR